MLDDQPAEEFDLDIPDGSDAPAEVRGAFWSLVFVFNTALLAISVGAMLVWFRNGDLGVGLFLAGVFAFAVGVYRIRTVKERLL